MQYDDRSLWEKKKMKTAEQETTLELKQLLTIWRISFQAFPHTIELLTSPGCPAFSLCYISISLYHPKPIRLF
jgi:hypothetical protein